MAETCTNIQNSIKWCEGTPSYPGVKRRLYFISKSQIVGWPTLTKGQHGHYTTTTYTGNFTLAAEAKWKSLDVDTNKSQLTSEAQGEAPSQTQLNKLVAVHPGTGPEASAAALYFNNNDTVFLVPDMNGNYRVVGSDKWQGKCTVAQDSGQGTTGATSTTINVEATDVCPAPFYTGKIEAEDGDFNADGSPVE